MEELTAYIEQVPEHQKVAFLNLRETLKTNLPEGFQEMLSYKMLGFVVPHDIYPNGYHCDPKLPLPFINLAYQKNFIALYHMGIYVQPELLAWFQDTYPKHSKAKLDMGKSCIRFKKYDAIPYELIAQLCRKISVSQWIEIYSQNIKPKV